LIHFDFRPFEGARRRSLPSFRMRLLAGFMLAALLLYGLALALFALGQRRLIYRGPTGRHRPGRCRPV
jgi:hypothetical protein